jgi:hypothetical protein
MRKGLPNFMAKHKKAHEVLRNRVQLGTCMPHIEQPGSSSVQMNLRVFSSF